MTVKIETTETQVKVYSPYNPDLPSRAKKLGGKWGGGCWTFDIRDEPRVRELYVSVYGTDGTQATGDLVTVRATITREWGEDKGGLFLFGRQVARATGRDSGATLADGVVVIDGKNFTSGGSVKNWMTIGRAGTVFEVRDVPRRAVENNGAPDCIEYEIIAQGMDRAALTAERDALLARLAEIDKILEVQQ